MLLRTHSSAQIPIALLILVSSMCASAPMILLCGYFDNSIEIYRIGLLMRRDRPFSAHAWGARLSEGRHAASIGFAALCVLPPTIIGFTTTSTFLNWSGGLKASTQAAAGTLYLSAAIYLFSLIYSLWTLACLQQRFRKVMELRRYLAGSAKT